MTRVICAAALMGCICLASAQGLDQDVPNVRPELIRAHLRFLADDLLEGRGTGTRGFQVAAAYVAAQFEALGLEPAFGPAFFQPVPLRHAEAVADESSITLARGQVKAELAYGIDFVTNGDVHRESASVDAPVVFVGDGISAPAYGFDDYADVDVSGKIVAVVLRPIPVLTSAPAAYFGNLDVRIEAALQRGAVGFLMLSQGDSFPWERNLQLATQGLTSTTDTSGMPQEPSRALSVAVLRSQSVQRLFAMASADFAGLLLKHRDRQIPAMTLPVTASIRIRSRHTVRSSPNVGAIIRGGDPTLRDEFVIYTAHLDHVGRGRSVDGDDIYNGAIDNASGVAAMIAMAHATIHLPTRPRRSIVFLATTGEEIGMLGSKYFASHPPFPLNAITAVLNVDGPTLMLFPVTGVRAQGGENSTLGQVAAAAANRLGLTISHVAVPTISDQGPFVLRGVPALWSLAAVESGQAEVDGPQLVRDWMSRTYHTPKDDLNRTLDYGAAATMAQFNLLVGLQVAQDENRPHWNIGDFFGDRFGTTVTRGK
jgi:hypothetical protein